MNRKRLHNEPEPHLVPLQQYAAKFRSKSDIYYYLSEQCMDLASLNIFTSIVQYCLPPIESINKDFLKQVFSGQKKLLKMSDIKPINVPEYDELSVKHMHSEVLEDEDIAKYFPDVNENSRLPERKYFFLVLNTLNHEYLNSVIKFAQSKRCTSDINQEKSEVILMSQEWEQNLSEFPFISKHHGRTLALLKKDSKLYKATRERKKVPLECSLKRFKDGQGRMIDINNMTISEDQTQMLSSQASLRSSKEEEKKQFII